jgi:hypothetical protein
VVDGHLGADSPGQGDIVIRVSHVTLPAGLSALARRGPAGELTVYVSDTLPPDRQRAAVRTALRASRRAGWHALMPAPSVALLAFGMTWLRRAAAAVRAHSVAWGTASAVLAAASTAVYFAGAPPHQHGPAGSAPPPAPAVSRSPAAIPGQPGTHPRAQPSARTSAAAPQGEPGPLATVAVRSAPAPVPTGSSSPAPLPSVSPSPVPSPAPTVSGRHCIKVLGIRTCLRVAL